VARQVDIRAFQSCKGDDRPAANDAARSRDDALNRLQQVTGAPNERRCLAGGSWRRNWGQIPILRSSEREGRSDLADLHAPLKTHREVDSECARTSHAVLSRRTGFRSFTADQRKRLYWRARGILIDGRLKSIHHARSLPAVGSCRSLGLQVRPRH
jgi:hypothetical protein